MDTHGYGGKSLKKNITVHTNDKENRKINLTITGTVERFVAIEPGKVRLTGIAGQAIKASVAIFPEEKYPFKIIETKAKNGKQISYTLSDVKLTNGTGYILNVENLKKEKGRYHDTIYLRTDSKIRPEIRINVYGNIYEKPPKGKE